MNPEERQRAFRSVERATALPMLALSLLLIPLLLIPLLVELPHTIATVWLAVDWIIWAAFALELIVKTYLAPDRRRYLVRHWFDVLIVVVPLLRPLRIAGSVRVLRFLRLLRLLSAGAKAGASVRVVLKRHGLQYILLLSIAVIGASAAAATYFERRGEGSIHDFGTALWWAMTTVTTVGYGDTYPVTPEGRGVGVLLMLVGITVFGLLTANIAAFFVESQQTDKAVTLDDVMAQLRRMEQQVADLHARLDGAVDAPPPTDDAVPADQRPERR